MENVFLDEIIIKSNNNHEYPFSLPVYNSGVAIKLNRPITFITGENGTGKSTLLEAIALEVGFNVSGGNQNHIYSDDDEKNVLLDFVKLVWRKKTSSGFFFRAESFFKFADYIDDLAKEEGKYVYNSYGGKSLQKQSHGESFLALFKNRFSKGLFILDEPEAALSPERQLSLIAILSELSKNNNCQFIIATHSPILIACPNSELYEIEDNKFILKNYKESKQYNLYKDFTANPEKFLKYLVH